MITMTPAAQQGIAKFLAKKSKDPIRVYPRTNHNGTITLCLALDKILEESDEVEETGGFTFCMNRDLKRLVCHVDIDQGASGLVCKPLIPLPSVAELKRILGGPEGGCSGCSGCS